MVGPRDSVIGMDREFRGTNGGMAADVDHPGGDSRRTTGGASDDVVARDSVGGVLEADVAGDPAEADLAELQALDVADRADVDRHGGQDVELLDREEKRGGRLSAARRGSGARY